MYIYKLLSNNKEKGKKKKGAFNTNTGEIS